MYKILFLLVLGYFIARSARSMIRAIRQDPKGRPEPLAKKRKTRLKEPEIEDARWVDVD